MAFGQSRVSKKPNWIYENNSAENVWNFHTVCVRNWFVRLWWISYMYVLLFNHTPQLKLYFYRVTQIKLPISIGIRQLLRVRSRRMSALQQWRHHKVVPWNGSMNAGGSRHGEWSKLTYYYGTSRSIHVNVIKTLHFLPKRTENCPVCILNILL